MVEREDRPGADEYEVKEPTKYELKLLFHDYKVYECINLVEDHDDFGLFDGYRARILIAANIPKKLAQEVLIHEIVESYNYHMELELKHNQITGIATMFTQFLLENKDFVRKFLKEKYVPRS